MGHDNGPVFQKNRQVKYEHIGRLSEMNSEIKAARMTGILFIACTGAAVVSGIFLLPILETPDYLGQISTHTNEVMLGALF